MNIVSENLDPTRLENASIKNTNLVHMGNEKISSIGSGKIVDPAPIGKGGMATVYKIWNEGLEQFRAVKLANPGQEKMFDRFKTEAKIASKLEHSNIIRILNVGDLNGLPFIEMEFIDGKTLRDLLKEKMSFPVPITLAMAIFITRALLYAFTATITIEGRPYKQIIHRDLKPENIMISKIGHVTLMDFGLAQPQGISLHTTQAQTFIGSPLYAAPEQFESYRIKPDHRADIYALGEILYEMMTGYTIIPDEILSAHYNFAESIIPDIFIIKSEKSFKQLKDYKLNIPSRLLKLVDRCLEPDRERRYQTSRELLGELESIYESLTKKTVEEFTCEYFSNSLPQPQLTDKKNFSRNVMRPVAIVASLAAIIVVLVIIFLKTGPTYTPQSVQPTVLKQPLSARSTNELRQGTELTSLKESETINRQPIDKAPPKTTSQASLPVFVDDASSRVKNSPDVHIEKGKSIMALPLRAKVVSQERAPIDTIGQGARRQENADPFTMAEAAIAKQDFENALHIVSAIPADHPKVMQKIVLMIDLFRKMGKFSEAKEIIGQSEIAAAEFDLAAGKVYWDMGNYQKAIQYFNQAQENKCLDANRRSFILEDALYCCAQASQKLYKEDKNQQNLEAARDAWNNVKKNLSNRTNDPRYKEAIEVLSKL
jgi:serine/threonine protein kinase